MAQVSTYPELTTPAPTAVLYAYVPGATPRDRTLTVGTLLGGALTAVQGLTPAADRLPYFTSTSEAALATFTAFGRTLVAAADAGGARTALAISAANTPFAPAGSIVATDVQQALVELDAAKAALPGYAEVATDADFTLTPGTDPENIRHTGELTAPRAVTLSPTGAFPGARFRLTRTGAGASDLDFGGLKALGTDTWAEAVFDGSAWYLAAAGTL